MALGVTTRAAGRHTSGQEAVDAELLSWHCQLLTLQTGRAGHIGSSQSHEA